MIHVETMKISGPGIVKAKCFEVPFVGLIWVIASCNVSSFEANAHLIDVYILIAFEVALIVIGEMIQKRCHTPKRIIFLKGFELIVSEIMCFDHVNERFDLFKPIPSKALFDEIVRITTVLGPIGPHRRLPFDAHMKDDGEIAI